MTDHNDYVASGHMVWQLNVPQTVLDVYFNYVRVLPSWSAATFCEPRSRSEHRRASHSESQSLCPTQAAALLTLNLKVYVRHKNDAPETRSIVPHLLQLSSFVTLGLRRLFPSASFRFHKRLCVT